ncbi:UDP-2,4-diacetamido-2,4,6-trideoxy-beta-L-altropyranose hydrolase [Polaromonas sp. SM01]|uniref:UDP-2,4-diacetamido-2,4, 6-trideoxy-beta-L-altropyranose hydrolase n=1 Tax=Polaromonas sp. SM01 TaxID=3085630 RepID=UPI002981C80F|nr:UDP-2,4-diacetamido-2,4,6-trideoxy-beta-L-altropyranose hydrolase [Polaromonas sp. SM01]MDW5443929.1 UDP-2,4-diacetamido-2,4,6-trideoxy-beta-L-altropyranose hydrolase [Polaromonas sp. SM01]
MNIVFRTDASLIVGTGHVMRCLTLAKALRERGAVVSFVCREHAGHLGALILEMGFAVHLLDGCDGLDAAGEASLAHAGWLGATSARDAAQTLAVVETMGGKPDWLVVDHYGIDQRWEGRLRPAVGRIMVIDDLADRQHDCDVLLDQNLVAKMEVRYDARLPASCLQLLGPRYALLQSGYAERHQRASVKKGAVRRILIYFGGADLDNLAGRSLGAFLRLGRNDIDVDLVVGNGIHAEAIRQQAANHPNIHLHDRLPTLAPLIEAASLGIGAGGSTSWERLCLGLPSIVVAIADNQVPIAAELGKRGLACSLGCHQDVDEATIASKLAEIVGDGLNEHWSQQCLSVVDGRGVQRVCAALSSTGAVALRSRPAISADEDMLLEWANDPATRRNALMPGQIDAATHRQWFERRLKNTAGCRIYIAETAEGVPAGQIRFERFEGAWEVHYALSPDFRGLGLGRQMLEQALATFTGEVGDASIIGRVKDDNRASLKIFESLGFDASIDVRLKITTMKRLVQVRPAQSIHEGP